MAQRVLVARPRRETGTAASRRLRRQGRLPASLYGAGGSYPIEVSRRDLEGLLREEGVGGRLLKLRVEGASEPPAGEHQVLIRELQVHPVTDEWLHVDFYEVPAGRPVRARVPVLLEGVEQLEKRGLVPAVGVRELEVECLPSAIPAFIPVNVAGLSAGERLTAGGAALPEGVRLLTDPDEVLLTAVLPEAEAAEEGALAPSPAAPAEPERITRPRKAEATDEA